MNCKLFAELIDLFQVSSLNYFRLHYLLLCSYAAENDSFFKAMDKMRRKPETDVDFARDAEFLVSSYLSPKR